MKPGNWIIMIGCACFLLGTATIVTGNQPDALIRAGEQGSINAQIKLGRRYLNGAGVKEDAQRAYFWYQKAAAQGDPRGQSALGWMYESGLGVDEDPVEAFAWYEKAAAQGHANASRALGVLYEMGRGVKKNPAKAAHLYRRAADLGMARAQVNLGYLYEHGLGVKQDYNQALSWYTKAAGQGYPRGQVYLGMLYEQGKGVDLNYGQALALYRKAARSNYSRGQYRLATLYEKGLGVSADPDQARAWYKKAAGLGFPAARNALTRLTKRLASKKKSGPGQKKTAADSGSSITAPPPAPSNVALDKPGSADRVPVAGQTSEQPPPSPSPEQPQTTKPATTALPEKSPAAEPLPERPHPPGPVTATSLLSVYRQAKKNDPQHLGALQQLAAQREGLSQAKAGLWPTIAVNGEYAKNYQRIISSDNTVYASGSTDFRSHQYTLTLTQPIFAYSSFVRVKQAKLEVKRADVEEKILSQELILRVAERYLQALAAMDELSFTRSELKTVTRQYDLAEEKQRTGLARITDLHDARARLASVKARELEAINLLADTLQGLQEVTGVLPGSLAGLRNEIPLVSPEPRDIDSWVSSALGQNLSLAVKKQAVQIARAEIKRQRGGHLPTLELVGSHNNSLTEGTLFGGGSEVETSNVFLRANLPIFQGGYVRSKVREATDMYKKAEKDFEQESRSVQRTARAAYSGVLSAISRVEALKQALDSQQLALEAKEEGLRSGLYTGLAVLDAERDLYLARRDYAKARYDYLLNSMRLKQAVGTLSDEDVTSLNDLFN